ncbi:Na+/H+ antiporter [Spiromyces aspiralis]|uniref:Na+/H+ antiporter n=1 Tax=Spiromyces aspiralis TaxID=68401 RepID=A0ACC1HR54_9FUNG|nr:Na+/H+ antiporter [Spiromyces aspiralis]
MPSEISIQTGPLQLAPALLGGFIVLFGLNSLFIKERLFLSDSLLATIYGIIIGPYVLNWIDPSQWADLDILTIQLARYVLAIQVMAAGVTLPKKYLLKEWKSILMLLFPIMSIMWILEALVIASCVTPTDPVLANSIVKGRFAERYVPLHLRNILSCESGANDGLGYPFLFFAIYFMKFANKGKSVWTWVYATWGYQVLLSIAIGCVLGYICRKVLRWAEERDMIDKESFLSFAIALTILIVGICTILDTDDILACFIAGNTFTWDDWFRIESNDAHFQEVLDGLFNITFFVYFGTVIPWKEFNNPSFHMTPARLSVAGVLIILFRRLPVVLASYRLIPAIRNYKEALFAGWFGPIGVSAVFYSIVGREILQPETEPSDPLVVYLLYPTVCFIVLLSVIIHGITVPILLLGRHVTTRTRSFSHIFSRNTYGNWQRGMTPAPPDATTGHQHQKIGDKNIVVIDTRNPDNPSEDDIGKEFDAYVVVSSSNSSSNAITPAQTVAAVVGPDCETTSSGDPAAATTISAEDLQKPRHTLPASSGP